MTTKPNLPPGPRSFSPLGNLFDFTGDIAGYSFKLFQEYGDVARIRLFRKTLYLVSNPTLVKYYLADNAVNYPKNFFAGRRTIVMGQAVSTSDGAYWKRHRRMVQPAFHRERLAALVPQISQVTEQLFDRYWEPRARSGEPFLLMQETSRLIVSIMGSLLHSEVPSEEICDAIYNYLHFTIKPNTFTEDLIKFIPMGVKNRRRFLNRSQPKALPSAYRLDAFAREAVAKRLAEGEGRDDMLGMMVAARDEKGEGFNALELRDEFVDFFYGGHVSMAIGTAWVGYILTQYPQVAERLSAEVEQVLGGRAPTLADIPSLRYVTQVVEETLRIHPPAPGLTRPALKPDRIGEYDVLPGTLVATSPFVMHRHPAYWDKPDEFNPDHFAAEKVEKRPRYVYIPFGAGQRVCIGQHLGMLMSAVIIPMMAQRYRLTMVADRPMKAVVGGTYYPSNLWMTLSPASRGAAPVRAANG